MINNKAKKWAKKWDQFNRNLEHIPFLYRTLRKFAKEDNSITQKPLHIAESNGDWKFWVEETIKKLIRARSISVIQIIWIINRISSKRIIQLYLRIVKFWETVMKVFILKLFTKTMTLWKRMILFSIMEIVKTLTVLSLCICKCSKVLRKSKVPMFTNTRFSS